MGIPSDYLDGLEEVVGIRFGWRARLKATGELLSDDDLRALMKRRSVSGGKRTWVTEHFVVWPEVQQGDDRSNLLHEFQELYESDVTVRRAFEAADGQRMFEKWIMKAEDGERPDEVHIVDASDGAPSEHGLIR